MKTQFSKYMMNSSTIFLIEKLIFLSKHEIMIQIKLWRMLTSGPEALVK